MDVQSRPLTLEECKRHGVEIVWFTPRPRGVSRNTPLVNINRYRVQINLPCRELMGQVPLKVDVAKQAKGYVMLRFHEKGALAVRDAKDKYFVTVSGLVGWLQEQGVQLGAYPVEWDAKNKCLYLRLKDVMQKKGGQA